MVVAKKRTPVTGRLTAFLRRMAGSPMTSSTATPLGTDAPVSISTREQTSIIDSLIKATQGSIPINDSNAYSRFIQPLARQIAATRLDAEAIERLAPEVKTAKEIVIPSIMSPTTLNEGEIVLQSTSTMLTEDQNEQISKLLNAHFNDTLKLSVKLPNWIHEGLYGAGAKPIMVLPVTEIDTIINDPSAVLSKTKMYGNESLRVEELSKIAETHSFLGIADVAHQPLKKNTHDIPTLITDIKPAVESIVESYLKDIEVHLKKKEDSYNLDKKWSSAQPAMIEFAKTALEQISIVDNPDLLKSDKARKAVKKAEITDRMITNYKIAPLITINPETKPSVDHPTIYELPPESVIPVFTPGTPSDHIGYFVLLDEYGNPIHQVENGTHNDITDSRQINASSLYKSFGFDSNYTLNIGQMQAEHNKLVVNVYQKIIEAHLKSRLKASGLSNIYIGAPSNVYKFMFSRYLSMRKTRLLFVPRDLMTYFCFRHNSDGTGRSKIEDIKFILSLKITMLICRVMAAMDSSINRKKISINFTDGMGDPIQYVEMLKKEAIDKSITDFTYDPSEISRTLAQRALTVAVKGIPGADNFEINSEPNESRNIRPDESLTEDLNNMMILGLDLPPSAFNMLNENEFSRSIATNNLFFSRRIAAYQKPVCEHTCDHVKIYTRMSKPLKDAIIAIIKTKPLKKDGSVDEAGTGEVTDASITERLKHTIDNIKAILPQPNVAPTKTEFEELDAIIASLSTTLEAVFDNDLGSTDDNPIALVRAMVKSKVVREYMKRIGVSSDIELPHFEADFVKDIMNFKLQMLNLTKGLKNSATMTSPTEPDAPAADPTF